MTHKTHHFANLLDETTASDDALAIRSLLLERQDALRRSDAEAAQRPYADDAVNFDLAPPLRLRGAEATDVEGIRQWLATWCGGVTTRLSEVTVTIEVDMAAVWGLLHMTGDDKAGQHVDEWSRNTVILGRREGAWKIIHEHSSYPLRMDGSGLAATDLKP